MASVSTPYPSSANATGNSTDNRWSDTFSGPVVLQALGSLKMTVALFAVSIVLVLVGTLAQDELNMQEVKQRYFLSWIAPLHLDDFFPQAFYRHTDPIRGVIPFPGGALVGTLLLINLIAAKITRFRIQASGTKLGAGIAFLLLGVATAAGIVFLGHNDDGLQGEPPISYNQLWAIMLAFVAVAAAGTVMAAWSSPVRVLRHVGYGFAALLLVGVALSLGYQWKISDAGLRIVWQLAKGLGAGLIMMVGCQLMFGKQGGNVLLHLGVGLLMVGQFAFGDRQTEQRLSLVEGESTNTFVNLDEIELQIMRNEDGLQHVIAVPADRLMQADRNGDVIRADDLPVHIRVLQYFENSDLVDAPEENPADTGIGLQIAATDRDKSGGANMQMNLPAAYVELIDPQDDESLGTFLVSQEINDREMLVPGGKVKDRFDSVEVGGETYQIGLRLHREVKPYWVQLEDVRRVNYSGTDTPRDYSSFIRIVDTETGDDRKERVWMNNPLRYRGETFYQSNYTPLPGGKELTGIQVVRNSGWLIPYVACSITGLGMLVHFWGTLMRFVRRRRRETTLGGVGTGSSTNEFDAPLTRGEVPRDGGTAGSGTGTPAAYAETGGPPEPKKRWPVYAWIASVAALVAIALIPASAIRNKLRPAERGTGFDLYAAGKIPVQFGGRVMPLDAYARQTLKAMTNKESLPLDNAPAKIAERSQGRKLSAVQWLMEVASDEPNVRYLPMFRIDADEVLTELGLQRRPSKLYSLDDIGQQVDRFNDLVEEAREKESRDQSFKDKKLIELDMRTRQYTLAESAMRIPSPPNIPAEFFPEGTSEATRNLFAVRQLQQQMEALASMPAPAIIPPEEVVVENAVDQPDWRIFAPAFFDTAKMQLAEDEIPPTINTFGKIITSYGDEDSVEFNAAVDEHLAAATSTPDTGFERFAVSLERWLGHTGPTSLATVVYLLAIVMGLVAFAIDSPRLDQAVWGSVAIAFAVHTIVLVSRIYITGRAPVINLYSSAVFIGWAAALFGLIVERIFRYGMGNMLAAVAGMMTLRVAYNLTLNVGQAETMGVLQAVLDTQFWLTTHVISVSLGYVATMVAGLLGIGYLIAGWLNANAVLRRDLYRVIYGASCFGILFSFIGTVLGGLWADDSWGRFWGWDPKENGALLIVIWNALMLHARWDGMVKATGFALLAIGGNIVTAWSWFGTNELGIGLHSYGFTEGMLQKLAIFFAVQAAFIIAGLMFPPRTPPAKTGVSP